MSLCVVTPIRVAGVLAFYAAILVIIRVINPRIDPAQRKTALWIGGCLTLLYLGVRDTQSLVVQMIVFATFSLVVKDAEQMLLGTWDHDNFLHIYQGNFAYVLGWSLADGLYPPLTLFGMRLVANVVPGLIVR